MKRVFAAFAFTFGIGFVPAAPALAADSERGYVTLAAPQPTNDPSKIEVVELFSYACPHCHHFEPLLSKWVAAQPQDVAFVRIPVVFRPSWEPLARAYYVAETLGVLDKTHAALFAAIHEKQQNFEDEDALAKFFVAQGVDEKAFRDAYNSFAVVSKLNRGKQLLQRYAVTGVPTLVINGKYRTSAQEAGGHEGMLTVTDKLVAQERAALKTGAAQ